MNICLVTMPKVQLQGFDLFFWVFGQVSIAAIIATVLIYFAARTILKSFPE